MNTTDIERQAINNYFQETVHDELEALSNGLKPDWKTKAQEPPPKHKGWSKEEVENLLKGCGISPLK